MIEHLPWKRWPVKWSSMVLAFCFSVSCTTEESSDKGISPSLRELLMASEQAIAAGDREQAIKHLAEVIAEKPIPWAFVQRGILLAKAGEDAAAQKDISAGLELAPHNLDLKWLSDEISKPSAKRFQGINANPPSSRK